MKHAVLINNAIIENFSIRHLSSYLKSKGFRVSTVHYESRKEAVFEPMPEASLKTLAEFCRDCDLVGINVMTSHLLPRSIQVTQYLKQHITCPLIWGGPPVIADPAGFLQYADYVCAGEGESVMEQLLNGVCLEDIPGLGYRDDKGKPVVNPLPSMLDLNALPIPHLDLDDGYVLKGSRLFPLEPADHSSLTSYSVILVRGCPYRCSYCLNSRLMAVFRTRGKYIRQIDVDRVIRELAWAKKHIPNLKRIVIDDDDFFLNSKDRMKGFLSRYRETVDLPVFYLQANTRQITREKLDILARSGLKLRYLKIGLQSASTRISTTVFDRALDKDDYLKKLEMIISRKIRIMIDVISDNPYETVAEKHEVLKFYMEILKIVMRHQTVDLPVKMHDHKLMFFPGTPLYERAMADGHIPRDYMDDVLKKRSTIRHRREDKDTDALMVGLFNIAMRKAEFYRTAYTLLRVMAIRPLFEGIVRTALVKRLSFLTRLPAIASFLDRITV